MAISDDDPLAELRVAYRAALPAKLADLIELLRAALAVAAEPALLRAPRSAAHRIAGTAASFGFPRVGEVCAAIEEGLLELGDAPRGDDARLASARATVEARLADLMQLLDELA